MGSHLKISGWKEPHMSRSVPSPRVRGVRATAIGGVGMLLSALAYAVTLNPTWFSAGVIAIGVAMAYSVVSGISQR